MEQTNLSELEQWMNENSNDADGVRSRIMDIGCSERGNVIHIAVLQNSCHFISLVLGNSSVLNAEDKLKLLRSKATDKEYTPIHLAVLYSSHQTSSLLKIMLAAITVEEHKLEILKARSSFNSYTALHYAVEQNGGAGCEAIKVMLAAITVEEHKLEILKARSSYKSYSALHHAVEQNGVAGYEAVKIMLETISIEKRYELLKMKSEDEKTVVHLALTANMTSSIIPLILPLIQEPERVKLLLDEYENKTAVVTLNEYTIAEQSENSVLRAVFADALFPNTDIRKELLHHHNAEGWTVMHFVARSGNVHLVECLLERLPEKSKMEYLSEKAKDGKCPLYLASKTPNALQKIVALFQRIPEDGVDDESIDSFVKRVNRHSHHYILHQAPHTIVIYNLFRNRDSLDRSDTGTAELESLQSAFTRIGLKVDPNNIKQDLNGEDLIQTIADARQAARSALIVFIMSHGHRGAILVDNGRDLGNVTIQNIISKMSAVGEECFPKILIHQSCQDIRDEGCECSRYGPDITHSMDLLAKDFTIIYPTLPRTKAVRNKFIPCLAQHINGSDDLGSILKNVSGAMGEPPYNQTASGRQYTQTPYMITNMLNKKLGFVFHWLEPVA